MTSKTTAPARLVLAVGQGQVDAATLDGAVVPVSTLFMFGIFFLIVVNVYFSIKVSTLTTQVKNLAQRLAILDHYVQEARRPTGDEAAGENLAADPPPAAGEGVDAHV